MTSLHREPFRYIPKEFKIFVWLLGKRLVSYIFFKIFRLVQPTRNSLSFTFLFVSLVYMNCSYTIVCVCVCHPLLFFHYCPTTSLRLLLTYLSLYLLSHSVSCCACSRYLHFLGCVTKYLTKVTEGRKGLLWLTVWEATVHHGIEVIEPRVWRSSSLSSFYSVKDLGIVAFVFRVHLLWSVRPF